MTIKTELQKAIDQYVAAYRAGDPLGCAACFTVDAVLISPFGPTARTRDRIAALHEDWVAGGAAKQMDIMQAGGGGDVAWCLARFSEDDQSGDGSSMCVFERQPDGAWLIRLCSLNAEASA